MIRVLPKIPFRSRDKDRAFPGGQSLRQRCGRPLRPPAACTPNASTAASQESQSGCIQARQASQTLDRPNYPTAHRVNRSSCWTSFPDVGIRSEEHTSELQSHLNIVCRLLLEKKNTYSNTCR